MSSPEASLLIRNILLLQLLTMLLVVPEYAFQSHRKLLKVWKSIMKPLSHKVTAEKKDKFWEIDMTKFEP
jgi:hypothetical protein